MFGEDTSGDPDSAFAGDEEIVIGAYSRVYLWLAVGYFLFGLVMAVCAYLDAGAMNTPSAKITLLSVLLIFIWLPSLVLVWLVIRTRVIADTSGLRWRGLGGWKSANWMQVRDYYIKVASDQTSSRHVSHIVETTQGNLDLKDLTHAALLRELVRERARETQTKSWQKRVKNKTLELVTPETFVVNKNQMRDFMIMLLVVVFVLPLLLLFKANTQWNAPLAAFRSIQQTWQTLGAFWGLGMILMLALPGLVYGPLLFASWPLAREAQQRRGQTLTVSADGLLWHDPKMQHEIRARWSEVRDFYVDELPGVVTAEARHVVETTRGNFDFVAMRNGERLQALIQKFCAENGLQREWENKRRRLQQSTPTVGGAHRHTYRQSEVRAMIWLVAAMMLSSWAAFPLRVLGWMPKAKAGDPSEWVLGLFMVSFTTIGGIWLLRKYFCFEILTDENGITQRCGRHSKFIAWADVREYETAASCIVVRSRRETIRFLSVIGAQKELQETIKTHATHSLTKAW